MKLSLNWLKDYIQLPDISYSQLLEKISLSICEIENVQKIAPDLKKILVAEVLKIKKHPNADRLFLTTVSTGKEQYEVVCGAKNFSVGDKVPYAPLGTQLEAFVVKKAKIRSLESCGVLCAEDEIGFSSDHEGLMILPPQIPIGTSLFEIYPDQKDFILDIDNKSINHRPDLWGHYGFARELSVLFDTPFCKLTLIAENKFKNVPIFKNNSVILLKNIPNNPAQKKMKIFVECTDLVPRFSALEIENLQNLPSPDWIRFRLYRVGLKAINNLVDVTNYIMLDLGQPMHIFDKEQLQGEKLIIRRAQSKEKLTTLYEKEIELEKEDIVITDETKPISLAGVVGGYNSGVKATTTNAVLEAACWDATTIRKTAAKTKHRTDASQRYEKSLDPHLTLFAIAKAVHLLQKTCPNLQRCGDFIDLKHQINSPPIIDFLPQKCGPILGVDIPTEKIENILVKLGFLIEKKKIYWKVYVPSWRATRDISLPEDLVEEVGRFFGYNKIIALAPFFPVTKPEENFQRKLERKIKQTLVARGCFEIFTYPIISEQKEILWEFSNKNKIKLLNPSSEEETQMRLSLLPSMVEAVSLNTKKYTDFSLFELGRVYFWQDTKKKEDPIEKNILVLANYSEKQDLALLFQKTKETIHILIEKLLATNLEIQKNSTKDYQHPFASGELLVFKQKIGKIFALSPKKKKTLSIKGNTILVEILFDNIFALTQKRSKIQIYQPFNKFPSAKFEISLVVPKETYFSDLKAVIEREKIVKDVRFQNNYALPGNKEKKSVTLSMLFCPLEETIKTEELVKTQDKIVSMFEAKGFMLRR